MIAQVSDWSIPSLAGNTAVGLALLASVLLFLKFLREERADARAEREAERLDRKSARSEYTAALDRVGESMRQLTDEVRKRP